MYKIYIKDELVYQGHAIPSTLPGFPVSNIQSMSAEHMATRDLRIDWIDDPEPVPPTEQELAEQFAKDCENAIQAMLDAKAKELEYDSIHTANGWVGELPECDILKAWGGAAWRKSKEIREAILAGTKTMPESVAAFMAEVPTYDEYVGGL